MPETDGEEVSEEELSQPTGTEMESSMPEMDGEVVSEEESSELTGTEMASSMPETDGEDLPENGMEVLGIQHGEETVGTQTLSQLEKFQLEHNGEILTGIQLKNVESQHGDGNNQPGDGNNQLGDGNNQLGEEKVESELERFQQDGLLQLPQQPQQ
jgi:hypothetical protein